MQQAVARKMLRFMTAWVLLWTSLPLIFNLWIFLHYFFAMLHDPFSFSRLSRALFINETLKLFAMVFYPACISALIVLMASLLGAYLAHRLIKHRRKPRLLLVLFWGIFWEVTFVCGLLGLRLLASPINQATAGVAWVALGAVIIISPFFALVAALIAFCATHFSVFRLAN